MTVYNCMGSASASYLSSPRLPSTPATCPGFANYLVCSPHNPEIQAEEGLSVAFLQRRKLKGTGLISCVSVKSSGSDPLGYHSEKGFEAESRPSGNNCADCLVISASLCCICCLCTGPVSPSQDGSPDMGPLPYPTMLDVQSPHWGLGRHAKPCVAGPPLLNLLPGIPPLNSGVMTAPEPLIWVLCPMLRPWAIFHLSFFLR